jgi:hypothetical protein
MLIDRPQIVEGSSIQNATVQSGNTAAQNALLSLASIGELFYNTELSQLLTFTGVVWEAVPTSTQLNAHIANAVLHLTSAQNTLLDGLSSGLTSVEVNYVQGVTSPIQTQFNSSVSNFTAHTSDTSLHLTSMENTFIDALNLPSLTAEHVNFVTGLNSNAQVQLDTIVSLASPHYASTVLHLSSDQNTFLDALNLPSLTASSINALPAHLLDDVRHLTSAQNVFLDTINLTSVSPTDFNRLAGIDSYLTSISVANIGSAIAALFSNKVNKSGDTMTGTLTFSGGKITGLPSPTLASDAVNKGYVDAFVNGLQWTKSVVAASTSNITLSGLSSVDGVNIVSNDRVLVIYQSIPAENGIYLASAGAWSRAADYATPEDINNSAIFVISTGIVNGKSTWVQISTVTNVGSDKISFTPLGGAVVTSAGNGIALAINGTVSVLEGAGLTFNGSSLIADIYSGGGIMTTLDGISASLGSDARLALTPTGVIAGTYNNSNTSVQAFTVNSSGRVTDAGSSTLITPAFSSVTGKPTTLVGYGISDAQPLDSDLSALANAVSTGIYVRTGTGTSVTRSIAVQGTGLTISGADGISANPTIISNATAGNVGNTLVSRDSGGAFSAGTITATLSGSVLGNASTASTLQTGRTIALSGAATGTGTLFDGSVNISIPVTALSATSLVGIIPSANLSGSYAINISGTAAAASTMPYSGLTGIPTLANWTTIPGNLISLGISWKNYGNGHVVFDASAGTSPTGSTINASTASVPWSATFPHLMGWNGSSTYGVRVDSARISDSTSGNAATATLAAKSSTLASGGGNGTGMTFNWSGQSGQPTWVWGGNDGVNMYVYNPSNFSVAYAGNAGNANSISNATGGGYVWTNTNQFKSNGNTANISSPPLQAFSDNASGAIMAFHRAGQFALNMGLDSDNVFRIGGWSAAANRLQMDMSGNLTMSGDVTAFSDIRKKTDISIITNALDKVQAIRGVNFTRLEDNVRGTGVIAQEVQEVLPEVVHTDADGMLSVAYGNMVGLLIEAIKELKQEVDSLKAELRAHQK